MSEFHATGALALAVTDLLVLIAAIALGLGARSTRLWLDRAILVALILAAIDALVGIVLIASGHGPSDLLHVVYGAAALLVLPIARWAGRGADPRRRALWVAAGSVVLAAVLLRLAQTG
ncbi:MAG TPA: hypothetical protein VGK63_04200 [Candidatus Limnocylindrales bacterium]